MGEGGLKTMTYQRGGDGWYPMTLKELKAFITCTLYMGLKRLSNVRHYWMRSEPFLYCYVISQLLSRDQ
jgi:hypothetical protein